MITIATNCGKFEQYSIHKRSFTALRYSFFLQGLPGLYSSRIMHVHMSLRLSNPILIRSRYSFFLGLRIRRICQIENEWDIVGRRIARDLRPVASTDEL
ncbi:hypothetical protein TNCV_4617481 [Trichonephila clavipes]|nr:hypothetical protein TNCV_4617481 [Trichonephila clavipes]